MEKILVPIDFSQTAEMAFNFATQMAKKKGSSITLLHSLPLPVNFEPTMIGGPIIHEVTTAAYDRAEQDLKDICNRNSEKNIHMDYFLREGSIMKVINEYRAMHHIDAIVMGTHGASGLTEIFIGSNAERVIRKAMVPVFTIPGSTSLSKIKNLVIPLDIEDLSDGFLHSIKELLNFFHAKPHFVHVDTPSGHINESHFVEELHEILKHRGFTDYDIRTGKDFSREMGIFHAVSEMKGDMICLATHGKVGLAHLLEGSLAEDIANHSRVPVWTYNLKMEEHFEEKNNLAFSV